MCAVSILCEDKGMVFGGIKVGRYSNLTHSALAGEFGFNGGLTEVTRQEDNLFQPGGCYSYYSTSVP